MAERTAHLNSAWISKVKTLMGRGYGYEDIAVKLKCSAEAVRNEAKILREMGQLVGLYRGEK